jgi:chromosome segregation ATPase
LSKNDKKLRYAFQEDKDYPKWLEQAKMDRTQTQIQILTNILNDKQRRLKHMIHEVEDLKTEIEEVKAGKNKKFNKELKCLIALPPFIFKKEEK